MLGLQPWDVVVLDEVGTIVRQIKSRIFRLNF